MEIGEFEIFCLRTFNELFKRAKSKSREKFITSLLALEEDTSATSISCTQEAEFHELSCLINDVLKILASKNIEKGMKARMRLFAYCHILDTSAIYQIVSNLSNIILNQEYDPKVYYYNKSGKKQICMSTENKVKAISIKVAPLDIPVDAIYEYVYYPKILDTFARSQYLLSEGANLVITNKIHASTSSTVKRYFRYSELKNIFDKSLLYLQTFLEIYGSHISEFRDGKPHPSIYGDVQFDSNRGWMLTGGKS